ncbi:MMPL family transporter [Methylomonas sp. LL1]|uniref:MMPL family transporter n=1 Tax=Methylomonas sp. LL1 TaxID=2785785 RepID=UPI0018C3562C|nr:MMPL family transporter [Methylomonas sp. LL1]QPK64441.1 MMPL family transporter [Methylomonas sp. LL1]
MPNNAFQSLAKLPVRLPWLILLLFIAASGICLPYIAEHLGVNNNTSEMLSPDLPFQKVRLKLEKEFPRDAAAILVVVESTTPEQTAMAADYVNRHLQTQTNLFESSYIPEDNPFFRRQGLLYLSLDDLEVLSTKLIDAQPFIGYLSTHYHFAGLIDIISLALEGHEQDLTMPLDPLLSAIDQTLVAVKAEQPHFLSWQQLLTETRFGRDQTRRLVIAKPHMNFKQLMPAKAPMAHLRGLADEVSAQFPGVTLSFTGEVPLEHEELETVMQGMVISSMASLLLVLIALWLGYRSWRLLFVTFIVLIIGLVLTTGFATLAVGHLNLISVAFATLYIGLGVDYATHFCLRYKECRRQGMPGDQALFSTINSIGVPLFLCAFTTAIGFFAFIPTDFKGVSELGVIGGVGIFIGFIVSVTLLPALLKLLPLTSLSINDKPLLPVWAYSFPFRHAKAIRIGAVLLAIGACFMLTRLTFDSNPVNLRDQNTQSVIAFKKLLKSKTDSPFSTSALTDSLERADQLAGQFAKLASVHETITLSDLVADQQEEKLEIIDNLNLIMPTQLNRFEQPAEPSNVRGALLKLAETLQKTAVQQSSVVAGGLLSKLHGDVLDFIQHADNNANPSGVYGQLEKSLFELLPHTLLQLRDGLTATAFGINDIPQEVRSQWVSDSGVYRVLVMPEQDLNNTDYLKTFVNDMLNTYPDVFGLPIGDVKSGEAIVQAFVEAFTSALLAIILLLLVQTRNVKTTLLIITPLLLASLLTGAANVLLNNPFNFANIIVLPLLLGIGVDSGIHIVYRLQHQHDAEDTVLQSSSARGVFYSALTTLCSFSSLAFNTHAGTASMGLLLAIGISLMLICCLLVLPAIAHKPSLPRSK